MLRLFINKEIYTNLTSKIFWVLSMIIFILNIHSSLLQITTYNNDKKTFNSFSAENQKFYSAKPEELQSDLPFKIAILPPSNLGMMLPELKQIVGAQAIDQNSTNFMFRNINFGIFTGIIFSLLAIILSFNTISGEREDGSLKLISSYPSKRVKIIIGKWIGIVTAIGLLYTACFITTTLLINLFADVQLGTTDMLSLLFIYIIGLFYISGMVLLGIYISIKIRHSYLSLLTSLLIWSLVVLVLPSIPDYMGRMIKVPSSLQVLNNETNRNIKWRDKKNEIKDRYRKRGIPEDKIYNEAKKDLDYAREQIMKEYKTFQNKWETALLKRVGVSTGTSLLSPYACYTLAINEMAATGVAVNVLLMQQRDKYSFKLNDYRKQEQERSKNDPNYKPDYSNIPRLKFEAPSIKVRAIAAAVPVLLLIIFNILFFVLSFRSFQRYDVR